jgi:hypothetical protein
VWACFQQENTPMASVASHVRSVNRWWRKIQICAPRVQRKDTIKLVAYIIWNIWKERGRRVFEGIEMNPETLAHHIREEMALVSAAYML